MAGRIFAWLAQPKLEAYSVIAQSRAKAASMALRLATLAQGILPELACHERTWRRAEGRGPHKMAECARNLW
jgi:hypothetical protein